MHTYYYLIFVYSVQLDASFFYDKTNSNAPSLEGFLGNFHHEFLLHHLVQQLN